MIAITSPSVGFASRLASCDDHNAVYESLRVSVTAAALLATSACADARWPDPPTAESERRAARAAFEACERRETSEEASVRECWKAVLDNHGSTLTEEERGRAMRDLLRDNGEGGGGKREGGRCEYTRYEGPCTLDTIARESARTGSPEPGSVCLRADYRSASEPGEATVWAKIIVCVPEERESEAIRHFNERAKTTCHVERRRTGTCVPGGERVDVERPAWARDARGW